MRGNILITLIAVSFILFGCEKKGENAKIIDINERMFATQINEIYLNAGDYMERTIKLEGIFKTGQNGGARMYYVIRFTPDDCCGDNGMAGFEVRMQGNMLNPSQIPEEDSWVEATGVLKEYGSHSQKFLYLELSSLVVLDRRGLEFVTR